MNDWREVRKKKSYARGFCIKIFTTLPDKTSHVDREHCAKGQHIDHWYNTLVIKGLLLQRKVRQEFLTLFHLLDPSVMDSRISWPPSVIDDLQFRLELGEEPAKDLAVDVRRACKSGVLAFKHFNAASSLRDHSEATDWSIGHLRAQD